MMKENTRKTDSFSLVALLFKQVVGQYGGSKLNTKKVNNFAESTFITVTVKIFNNTAISGQ